MSILTNCELSLDAQEVMKFMISDISCGCEIFKNSETEYIFSKACHRFKLENIKSILCIIYKDYTVAIYILSDFTNYKLAPWCTLRPNKYNLSSLTSLDYICKEKEKLYDYYMIFDILANSNATAKKILDQTKSKFL